MLASSLRRAPRGTTRSLSAVVGAVDAHEASASSLRSGEYGLGGRHSVSGVRASLFGATGFLGRYVCSEMGKVGTRVRVGNRGSDDETRHLKVSFDHGQFHAPFYSPRDAASVQDVIGRATCTVNMVGKYYETKGVVPTKKPDGSKSRVNYSYEETNVDVARTIAKAAREAGCEHFIHVSCAAQSPDSPVAWARAKAKGEQAVLEEFPNATIVRPCALFGPEDRLLNWFATVANMPLQVVPLVDDGRAVVQPTYVADVAKVINKIATEPSQYQGKVVELGGPAEYTRRELAEFTFDVTKQKAKLIDVPASMAAAAASFVDVLPVPLWVPDDVELDRLDVVCSGGEDADLRGLWDGADAHREGGLLVPAPLPRGRPLYYCSGTPGLTPHTHTHRGACARRGGSHGVKHVVAAAAAWRDAARPSVRRRSTAGTSPRR